MSAVLINNLNFETEVQNSNLPVLLDFNFWSSESPGADTSLQIANSMSGTLKGKIKVGAVDVNESPELVQMYKIRAIPTLLLIKNGKVTDTIVGHLEQKQILGIIS